MQLRSYQEEAIQISLDKLNQGVTKQVMVLATGLGKTVIFSDLLSKIIRQTGKKALVLAHREELLTQAKDKILKVNPQLKVDIEMADQHAESSSDVIVASVATIGRIRSERIKKFNPQEFGIVVVDEAHHASASTYKNVLAHFGLLKDGVSEDGKHYDIRWQNNDCLLLGVTATPSRMDNAGIDQIFDDVVFNYGILEGIRDGWLSRIRAYRVDTSTSLENVHTLAGDFNQGELADAINNPERNSLVLKTYFEQFLKKQALIFAIDVAHANALQRLFEDHQIKSAVVDGTTPKDARRNILEAFHNKDINVVINCMVLTEGYDNDTIDVIMMARPTKSGILYQQMVGRGTRTHHEKPYLTIVDFVDNTYKHALKTSSSLLGLDAKINFQGQDILDSLEKIEEIRELAPDFDLNRLDFNKLDYVMEEVDLMGGLNIPKDIQETTHFAWLRHGENAYRIGIGDAKYFVVQQTLTGQWEAVFQYWDRDSKKILTEKLGEEPTKEAIIARVDQYIRNNYEESLLLINMEARWRKEQPTDKQIEALQKLGVSIDVIAQLNKGQASMLQTKLYAKKGKEKRLW